MQEVQIVQVRPWYHKPAPWIALGVATCTVVLAMPHAQRIYHRWSEVRKVERATELLAKKDYQNAALNARGALATNPKHVEATRLMARLCEAVGSPDVLRYRQQLDALKPGDTENLIGLADHYLKFGNANAARSALQSIAPQEQTSARYFDVAAGVSLAQQDMANAEIYASKAVALEPANEEFQLRLAALHMSSKSPELRTRAVETLQRQVALPATRVRALRTLLHDALDRSQFDHALELAESLSTSAEATFADRLIHLSTLHALRTDSSQPAVGTQRVKPAEFEAALEKMQAASLAKPEDIFQMLTWMNDHHMALLAQDWGDVIPAQTAATSPVYIALAETYRRCSSWSRLRAAAENANWDKADCLRLAYLSLALESLGDAVGASTAWTKSVDLAQAQSNLLELLARETIKWGWKRQSEELLWKLTARDNCPRWAIDNLWASSLKRQDPTMLFKLSKVVVQAEPKNVTLRNHYVSLALITGQEGESAHSMAEANYKATPDNVAVASTYGLSLFLRGRAEEAVGVMSKFPKEQLRAPALAFYQGIFLAGAGRPEEGEEYFRIGEQAPQFAELIAIRNFLRTVFEADAAQRAGEPVESAKTWQATLAAAQAQSRWLELLGRLALKWGRADRAGDAAYRLADLGLCPDWAVDPLWAASLRSGDSVQIQKISKLIFDTHPKSLSARGNFVMAALLADKSLETTNRQAEQFHRENPGQPEAVLPLAYVLYRQGKSAEALALLKTLEPKLLSQPRPAIYYSLFLAASTQAEDTVALAPGVDLELFPEEKTISSFLKSVSDFRTVDRGGDVAAADAAWKSALTQAQGSTHLLETLARLAQKWENPQRAEEALWKLADSPAVPRWAIDALMASAEKRRDSMQLYRATRLLRRAEPENVSIRTRYVWLALLTKQNAEMPDRAARELYEANPRNPEITVAYGLSLLQQKKADRAAEVVGMLTPAQLRTPRVALFYGIFLRAAGKADEAQEYLQIGSGEALLPEEQTLLAGAKPISTASVGR